MSRWMVYKIAGIWQARDPEIDRTAIFFYWEDAIHYANVKARTVEVTLPRIAPHPIHGYLVDPDDPWVYSWDGRWHLAPIGDWDSHAALLCNDVGEYKIHASELKPLALALLAQHYRKEEQ